VTTLNELSGILKSTFHNTGNAVSETPNQFFRWTTFSDTHRNVIHKLLSWSPKTNPGGANDLNQYCKGERGRNMMLVMLL
jgi:hypothetical protein